MHEFVIQEHLIDHPPGWEQTTACDPKTAWKSGGPAERQWKKWRPRIQAHPAIDNPTEWWKWLTKHPVGECRIVETNRPSTSTLVVRFENDNDAFEYKMRWC
ncbi:protein of unknown function [Methylorubrum extorquens DM4]|uniref:Uncharacterized protein n=1 Tax=Methylorubrum extorquens (strain DSM 6343 / CIP 106787 / DM4) TaxID=661410 RepID=C7C7A4_METED|nr:hypothetical protein [Methylorubrum extorquens]CAX25013.1 protein of unknown function [Methylorubrum extorquens DM4]